MATLLTGNAASLQKTLQHRSVKYPRVQLGREK